MFVVVECSARFFLSVLLRVVCIQEDKGRKERWWEVKEGKEDRCMFIFTFLRFTSCTVS